MRAAVLCTLALLLGCSGSPQSPSAPTAMLGTEAPIPPPPGVAASFTIDLPIAAGDEAANAYGIWPFGVHGGTHAADGHPGFDVEFRPGAQVRAAADGLVLHVVADSHSAGRYSIRIDHGIGAVHYATDYTNISDVASNVTAGATVRRGQPLGNAGTQTQFIGTSQVTWAMTHFQVNDFSRNEGLTNPNAVSPEAFLSGGGRSLFAALWRTAAYQTEWCEPFATNSRHAGFPMRRTWSLRSGSLPARIDVGCLSDGSADYEYTFRAADGSQMETGRLTVNASAKPRPTVEARPAAGLTRHGIYDIVEGTMELNLGAPGAARPSSLSGASVYTSSR